VKLPGGTGLEGALCPPPRPLSILPGRATAKDKRKGGIGLGLFSKQGGLKNLLSPRAMSGAVVAVIVDEELKVLHVAEEARRLDHLESFRHGGLFCHLHHKAHEVSYIVWLAHLHASMT